MTGYARQVTKNSMWAFTARIIEVLCSVAVIPIVARYLDVEEFGLYSFIMAASWMLSPFLILGLPRILAREIAQNNHKAEEMVSAGLSLVVLIAGIILGAFLVALFFVSQPKDAMATMLGILGIVFMMGSRIFVSVFIAFEKIRFSAVTSFTSSMSLLILTLCVIYFKFGFVSLFIAFALSNLLGFLAAAFLSLKYFSVVPQFKIRFENVKYIVKESWPVFISQLLVQGQQFAGVLFLKLMSSYFDVGLFQAPQRILGRMQMLPIAFMIGLLPLFSRLSANTESHNELKNTVLSVCKLLVLISLPVSVCVFMLSDDITMLMFGEKYIKSGLVLKILIFSINFTFISNVFELLFISVKRQKDMIIINAIGILSAVLLCFLLVPAYGYVGASIAYMSSTIVIFLAAFLFLKDIVSIANVINVAYRPFVGAVIIGLYFQYVRGINLLVLMISGVIIYFVSLLCLGTFSFNEIMFMKKIAGIRKANS